MKNLIPKVREKWSDGLAIGEQVLLSTEIPLKQQKELKEEDALEVLSVLLRTRADLDK